MADLSLADIAALNDNNMGGGNVLVWLFAMMAFMNGGFGFNRQGSAVTASDLSNSQNQQTLQMQLNQLQASQADNKFDIAQAINAQTTALQQQQNTFEINALQAFNSLSGQVTNQTNQLGLLLTNGFNQVNQGIQALSAQQEQCCCKILTQMLQDRLSDAQALNVTYRGQIDNAAQTQTILNTMGHWVANAAAAS